MSPELKAQLKLLIEEMIKGVKRGLEVRDALLLKSEIESQVKKPERQN